MITFCNFAIKTETSWAKMVTKSILETENVTDVSMYIWDIHFEIMTTWLKAYVAL